MVRDDDRSAGSRYTIQVGATTLPSNAAVLPARLDGDGFVIRVEPEQGTVIIRGATAWGTEFGVYAFLEEELGVRWLLPGPDGEDVPRRRTLAVAKGTRVRQPAFKSPRPLSPT